MLTTRLVVLGLALVVALAFEFVNGFHDTANAVATVIYTRSLKPSWAVIWSGFCNFAGVLVGGIAVAMSVVKLLPVELLVQSGPGIGLAMVLSLLLAAITWNLATWALGLPASSSHTLIGAILGVALANSLTAGHSFGDGVNWTKAGEVGLSLFLSPIIGFSLAAVTVLLFLWLVPSKALHNPPEPGARPPTWIRALLIGTCSGVSFAHGSNDGQKGVGLIMLILVGILPASFALDPGASTHTMSQAAGAAKVIVQKVDGLDAQSVEVRARLSTIAVRLDDTALVSDIPANERFVLRRQIFEADAGLDKLLKAHRIAASPELERSRGQLRAMTDYAPRWVLVLVALALGVGTTVGWKRIVVTIGEKIGKAHLTYAQGASAELVAMVTIGLGAMLGLPVSTTHVLSSGVAGTMVARRSGLQMKTVRNIALAWVLTLPAVMLLSGAMFLLLRRVLGGVSF
ncbi:MAG: inorganic phosphate transporter [Polyangia bacterium]